MNALLAASQNGDTEAVSRIWRELPAGAQESVLFALLQARADASNDGTPPPSDASHPSSVEDGPDTEAMDPVEETELIPKGIEELHGLAVSDDDGETAPAAKPILQNELAAYWSRWRRRWKLSAVVAAWAVTTVFAFTADTSAFGPMEWIVAMCGTVFGGGILVGTLLNFAVAAVSGNDSG